MKLASISELKDGLSAHLDLVRAGETVVVTDRRLPVATLERIAPGTLVDEVVALVAEERVAPRKQPLAVESFLAMPRGDCSDGLGSAIIEERQDGR